MFTDKISDTWDTSEFQESFIANYFGKKRVSKQNTAETLQFKKDFDSTCPGKSNYTTVTDVKHIKRKFDVSSESNMTEKDLFNLSTNGAKKKKRKKNEISQFNKCVANGDSDSDLEKWDSEFPNVSSEIKKSKKKRKRKLKNKNKDANEEVTSIKSSNPKLGKSVIEGSKLELKDTDLSSNLSTSKNFFQSKLSQKLQAAKFRYLNEMLYTSSGKDALEYFQENTEEFQDYHGGYQSQVSKWPINPVDIIIDEIQQLNKQCVIADLGCGEAKIAEKFPKRTVHSFDLIALKDSVTACDMSNVPLPSSSVDVVVFCLSLMGTNWKDYLREGQRLLKLGGLLKIAEIESRIENSNDFIKSIEAHGFSLVNKNLSHKMFVFLNFKKVKSKVKSSKIPQITLKPCLYKRR